MIRLILNNSRQATCHRREWGLVMASKNTRLVIFVTAIAMAIGLYLVSVMVKQAYGRAVKRLSLGGRRPRRSSVFQHGLRGSCANALSRAWYAHSRICRLRAL
ncbi:hypothetical protein Micbo1qcDRAFT_65012 [Microdochium bolleyi]|uniref:Uncharacterized protein n=1 Tax=Microdochium bolleyi TaxID=196109 RepID=A0A136J340_9PEZI|nr:hypothetical protein Micbo1qcDRAFT_65012 [Microdochium bolleyi]